MNEQLVRIQESGRLALERNGLTALLETETFQRLGRISFMGALSEDSGDQSTRLDHSLAVVHIADLIGKRVNLQENVHRYLIAAALIHDAASFPLSHTCEGVLGRLAKVSHNDMRMSMIFGEGRVSRKYHLNPALEDCGLAPYRVYEILEKERFTEERRKEERTGLVLCIPGEIFASPLNPDTIDGMFRLSFGYNVRCPSPEDVIKHISGIRNLFFSRDGIDVSDKFWTAKSLIYRDGIYSKKARDIEDRFALAVSIAFDDAKLNANDILEMREEDLCERISTILPLLKDVNLDQMKENWFRPPKRHYIDRKPLNGTNHNGNDNAENNKDPLHLTITELRARYKSVKDERFC